MVGPLFLKQSGVGSNPTSVAICCKISNLEPAGEIHPPEMVSPREKYPRVVRLAVHVIRRCGGMHTHLT